MVFSSLIFLYAFLPLCMLFYFLIKPLKGKNGVLIVFSLLFYSWGEPVRVLYLLLSAVVNYFLGMGVSPTRVELKKDLSTPTLRRKILLAVSLVFNIGMIGVFKYSRFVVTNINGIFGAELPVPDIVPMIGISFYTFQVMSYVIDCYWEKVKPQLSFYKLLLYICLFPQLIAGPIVRYSTIAEEIDNRRSTVADISTGISRFIMGLAKKVILANQLYRIVDSTIGKNDISGLTILGAWYGVIVYSLYVYFDFSGYSDMAIGLGRIFGFHFNENFNHPYLCKDITEFWQRWHISLGSFFRDYLLPIPVFGIRNKYTSLFLVWLCTGIWHGANWNYIIWGLYYGCFIMFETALGKKRIAKIPMLIRHIYTKLVITIGFGIFFFEDLGNLGTFLKCLLPTNANGWSDMTVEMLMANNLFLVIAAVICSFPLVDGFKKLSQKSENVKSLVSVSGTVLSVGLLLLSSVLLVDATTNVFLYWNY